MNKLKALLGEPVTAIDTPALVVDLDAMERNLTRMAEFTARRGVRLRPHAKMHKCAELARLQMQAGAVGICVQKTAEALVLASGGLRNIYISNQVVAPRKLQSLVRLACKLAQRGGQLALAVDSAEGLRRLIAEITPALLEAPKPLDVLVELDVGQGRCGVRSAAEALALAQTIAAQPGLRFAGLQAYHGKAQHLRGSLERRQAIAQATAQVLQVREALEAADIAVPLVTGAGSGSFALETASGVYGELQAGSYLFMDADYARNEPEPGQPRFEHALFVKSEVISVRAEHAVCDAGIKSHAMDAGPPRVHGQELVYSSAGDEHGLLHGPELPAIGDTVWLIPGHCDPTVNLYSHMIGVRGGMGTGRVERILRVDARGALA